MHIAAGTVAQPRPTIVLLHERASDGKAQAGVAGAGGTRRVGACEGVEGDRWALGNNDRNG